LALAFTITLHLLSYFHNSRAMQLQIFPPHEIRTHEIPSARIQIRTMFGGLLQLLWVMNKHERDDKYGKGEEVSYVF